MPDILHRIGVNAPAEQVYASLATTEGLRNWWTDSTTGDTKVGGTIGATFLLSLRDDLESGKGRPAPRDVKIHVGD